MPSADMTMTIEIHDLDDRHVGPRSHFGERQGVSVYGLGRFPVTLYKEQWAKLLDMVQDIRTFIKDNEGPLKSKGK